MATSSKYVPGVCNIGPAEIKRRRQTGIAGLILTVAAGVLLVASDVPAVWRLLLFFPVAASASGFIQAKMHFCAHFGFSSLFNFEDVGTTESVELAEFRKKDRRKAWQIVLYSVLIGLTVAITAYLL